MSKLYLITILSIILLSCQKDELNSEIPNWLQSRIEEIEESEQCKWYFINSYLYKKELYYDVVNAGINCILCEVYDKNGNLVKWDGDEKLAFLKSRTDETFIWSCTGSIP